MNTTSSGNSSAMPAGRSMPLLRQWALAWRLLWREARSGELTLILLALLIAVTSTTAISLFSSRLELALDDKSSAWLGADMRVRSSKAFSDEQLAIPAELGLKQAQALTFPSVVLHGDDMTLAAIKAVDDNYPMQARLNVITEGNQQPQLQNHGPARGEAWVEPRLLALLNASVGDNIELGDSVFRVTGEITEESDRGGGFYSLSPRMMVHWDDVQNSPLLGPGSRLRYRLLLEGSPTQLQQFEDSFPLTDKQRIETLEEGNRRMSRSLDRAREYLALASLLAVVLASIAVAISAQRYAQRHFDISALMRTFGLKRNDVLKLYLWQLLMLGLAAAAIGALLALGFQAAIISLLADVLPEQLPAAPALAWLLGLSSGLVTLLGFGVPHLLPLANVAPLRVLRRDLTPVPLAGWMITAVAIVSLALLLWVFTGDLLLTLLVMGGGSALVLVLLAGLQGAIVLLRKRLANRDLPLNLRFAWQHLSRNSRQTAGQILAFSLTLQVMIVIAMLRNDLLADWQNSLPQDAPNVFALNIQSYDKDGFEQALESRGFVSKTLYPMVPGRLLEINGTSIQDLKLDRVGAIDRDLALTADDQLPDSNRVVAGDWSMSEPGQLSMEVELAERLGVKLGDTLSFRAAGVDFEAEVSSFREVDWTSLSPNFFMMFSPDIMEKLPPSYITSFNVPDGEQAELTSLIREFPAVNILDMQALLTQLHTLLQQITLAVELILVVVLVAAVLVMVSALVASLRERLQEGALLRTLGASTDVIRKAQLTEFGLLGLVASVMALVSAELLCWSLYTFALNIPYKGLGWIWLWLPVVAALALALLGSGLLRKTVRVAPLRVIRELG
ncbi:ABC transporter permease [Oceanobacter kriegii]|uniref:ABC transporter permease n=1 Tax=Oceanobacter kriegii TaxID=64972 RepID=UPI000420B3F2|nr:FtsX-like permease family protein [Oceanobacter kriegii]